MRKTTIPIEREALKVVASNYEIIPLLPKSKKPAIADWSNQGSKLKSDVRQFFANNPTANFGILTGAKHGLAVLDVDGKEGQESLKRLVKKHGPLPKTVRVKTPRGQQIYLDPCGVEIPSSAGKLGKGLDIRAEGGQVVGAGSTHPSGGIYKYKVDRGLTEAPVAPIPKWLCDLCLDKPPVPTVSLGQEAQGAKVAEGGRNNHLASLAGTLRRAGAAEKVILAALTAENADKCDPPLPQAEVEQIAKSIAGYQDVVVEGANADAGLQTMQAVLQEEFAGGAHLLFEQGYFWRYGTTHWRRASDEWIKGKVMRAVQRSSAIGGQTATALINQVHSLLKAHLAVDDDRLGLIADPPLVINCSNGELWIAPDGSVNLRPHSPTSYLRQCLAVAYDPAATCPEYDDALTGIFSRADDTEAMIRHWHELAGYIIQPTRDIATVLILLGAGNNGKTRLVETIIHLLGSELVCAEDIQKMDSNKFAMGDLFGKLMLYDDDVKAGVRLPDGLLKKISERKLLRGEEKWKPSYNFIARTVPVLLCNNVPSLADLSFGMLRRLQVIPFDRKFKGRNLDLTLFDRIWKSELPGVLNRAIQGLQRLRQRGSRFAIPKDVRATTKKFVDEANPLPAFISEECEVGAGCKVSMAEFYIAYSQWAKDSGITMTQQRLTVRKNLEHMKYKYKRSTNGTWMLFGLKLSH